MKNHIHVICIIIVAFTLFAASSTAQNNTPTGSEQITSTKEVQNASGAWNTTYDMGGRESVVGLFRVNDGYVLVGNTREGTREVDTWIMKVNNSGGVVRHTMLGQDGTDQVESVTETRNGYVLAGYKDRVGLNNIRGWAVKVNKSGEVEWQHTYAQENRNSRLVSVAETNNGYVFVGRSVDDTNPFASSDLWVVRTDSDGGEISSKNYGGGNDEARAVVSGNETIVSGVTKPSGSEMNTWMIKLSRNDSIEWKRNYGGNLYELNSLISVGEGYLAVGSSWSDSGTYNDLWVVRTDRNGSLRWTSSYGGSGLEEAVSVSPDPQGGYVAAGSTSSFGSTSGDAWLVGFNDEGIKVFDRVYGGDNQDSASAVLPMSDGGYVLAGTTSSFGSGNQDVWLIHDNEPRPQLGVVDRLPIAPTDIAGLVVLVAVLFVIFRLRRL